MNQNTNITQVLQLTDEMIELANKGDRERCDPTCGVLYGVLRDSAYKLRHLATKELEIHSSNNLDDIDDSASSETLNNS